MSDTSPNEPSPDFVAENLPPPVEYQEWPELDAGVVTMDLMADETRAMEAEQYKVITRGE